MGILDALVENCLDEAGACVLEDVRVGLGYTCAVVSDGRGRYAGLAATLLHEVAPTCVHHGRAGRLAGAPLEEVLAHEPKSHVDRAVALACCNAVLNRDVVAHEGLELELAGRDVGMVGYFAPLVRELREVVRSLTIVERNEALVGGEVMGELSAIEGCDVVLVSSSTLVNGTVDEVLSVCGGEVVMLGPSTPLTFSVFPEKVVALAGRQVVDIEGALRVVSEAGGTPQLSCCTKKLTLLRSD